MNRDLLLGALIVSLGLAAGQIVPWYIDRRDRLILAEQQEVERVVKETRRLERIRQAEIERAAEDASRQADSAKAKVLSTAAIQDARSHFEASIRPLAERYLTAHWKTLADLTGSLEWQAFKSRLNQVDLADENLGAGIMASKFDPAWASAEKNRLNRERASAHQENVLFSMLDGYLSSGRREPAQRQVFSVGNLELARTPEEIYSLGSIFSLYGITRQQRDTALRGLKARFLDNLGTDFDLNEARAANRIWLTGVVLANSTIEVGSSRVRLGPETPGNVVAPLCEDPRFTKMASSVIKGKDACTYRLIDLQDPASP